MTHLLSEEDLQKLHAVEETLNLFLVNRTEDRFEEESEIDEARVTLNEVIDKYNPYHYTAGSSVLS